MALSDSNEDFDGIDYDEDSVKEEESPKNPFTKLISKKKAKEAQLRNLKTFLTKNFKKEFEIIGKHKKLAGIEAYKAQIRKK